jgi:hypothetical protein
MWSLWCAAVLLLATWSSPATAITPPCGAVPAMLACLNTSRAAVHARALAVPDAEHAVELLVAGSNSICCVPHTAVAASSSLTPGWNTMFWAARCFLACHSAWS